jgi:hypothetical protein
MPSNAGWRNEAHELDALHRELNLPDQDAANAPFELNRIAHSNVDPVRYRGQRDQEQQHDG